MVALCLAAPAAMADPGFLTLDRMDFESRAGGEFSYISVDANDVTSLRFDLHGHYVVPSGFGGYAALPISYLEIGNNSETAIGNIELGGIFVPHMASPNFSLVLHGGVTLPTAGDSADSIVTNAVAIVARITDVALIIPEGFTLRLGASPLFRSGMFFGRIDGGLDLNLSAQGDNADPLVRFNLGGGLDLGTVSLTGEFAILISTEDNLNDNTATTLGVGVRGHAGKVQPYGGIVVPLDDEYENIDFVVTLGLDVALN